MAEFKPPNFLRKEIETKPLHSSKYGEGAFTVVANMTNLPEKVRQLVPDGYVVKQYKDDKLEIVDIFEGDIDFDIGDSKSRTSTAMAKKLQERQRMLQNYFDKTMPELIVPSLFVIGSDQSPRARGVPHIYEIQKKLSPGAIEFDEYANIDDFIGKLRALYKERLPIIKRELQELARLAEEMPDKLGCVFDLSFENILFDRDGLRIIDTNFVIYIRDQQGNRILENKNHRLIYLFAETIRKIKEIIKKL